MKAKIAFAAGGLAAAALITFMGVHSQVPDGVGIYEEWCSGGVCQGDTGVKDGYDFYLGTDADYWWTYNTSSTQLELWSTNTDGSGTDGLVLSVDDGDAIIDIPAFNVKIAIPAAAAVLGPTAPTAAQNDSCSGLAFDANAEKVTLNLHIPSCYADLASSDAILKIHYCVEDGQSPDNGEVIKWDIRYRSLVWGTEDVDNGTLATGSATYTQSGAGDEGDTFEASITLDADDGNQPIDAGDFLAIEIDRDWSVANNYPHDAIAAMFEIQIPVTSLHCDHTN